MRSNRKWGVKPVVLRMTRQSSVEYMIKAVAGEYAEGTSLQDFIAANQQYVDDVSEIFSGIPTSPH